MEFDVEHKVKIETMTREEAKAFIIFLESERLRHLQDVKECVLLITLVKERYIL